ncbi:MULTISPECIES: hypothetical protein [unclassified Paenibacillus]|uniref:hypothetical protein n=1 Tax=unclassified Paenibacillus TaxID=185978 RepID=UPI001915C51F|nr:hypothetical protein [Paenibacillus sp. EPM92]
MNQPWVYIVLFGLVIIVYAKLLPKKAEHSAEIPTTMKDVESAMDHFAVELEEQNKTIIQLFTETKKDYEVHAAKLASRVETLEKHNQQLQSELHRVGFVAEQIQKHQAPSAPVIQAEPAPASAPGSLSTSADPARSESPLQAVPVADQEPAATREQPNEPVALMNIKQRYAELFELYELGKSMDFIAKKLGMNKGEISLILLLAKQEERP